MKLNKMWQLVIRIKKNDNFEGKRIHSVVLDILQKGKISGATVWTGVAGYGKRGKSTLQIEGISVNMPLLIEAIDEIEKIEAVIPEIKSVVDDNGLITVQEVGVV